MAYVRTVILALVLTALAAIGTADTYTVTSTGDSGPGTLRQAILDANAHPGADTIEFNIAGSGVHTISPASALPAITDPVTIDGYSQPGSLVNTNPTSQGLNTVLRIEIDGTNAGSSPCLHARADDITIRGLVVNRCTMYDIQAEDLGTTRQNFVVEGCFLATNADGTQALSPSNVAINIDRTIRMRASAARPRPIAISSPVCNGGAHIVLGIVTGTVVQGNLIGTDVTGLRKITTSLASVSIADRNRQRDRGHVGRRAQRDDRRGQSSEAAE